MLTSGPYPQDEYWEQSVRLACFQDGVVGGASSGTAATTTTPTTTTSAATRNHHQHHPYLRDIGNSSGSGANRSPPSVTARPASRAHPSPSHWRPIDNFTNHIINRAVGSFRQRCVGCHPPDGWLTANAPQLHVTGGCQSPLQTILSDLPTFRAAVSASIERDADARWFRDTLIALKQWTAAELAAPASDRLRVLPNWMVSSAP